MFKKKNSKNLLFINFLVSNVCDNFPKLNCSYGCRYEKNGNSYEGYCFCESGFRLDIDNSTCKGMNMKLQFYINILEYTRVCTYFGGGGGMKFYVKHLTIINRDTHISINLE